MLDHKASLDMFLFKNSLFSGTLRLSQFMTKGKVDLMQPGLLS